MMRRIIALLFLLLAVFAGNPSGAGEALHVAYARDAATAAEAIDRSADERQKLALTSGQRTVLLGGSTDWHSKFRGTGRVALMLDAVNNTAFGSFGDNAAIAKIARRVGQPWYRPMRELTSNVWLGYEVPTVTVSANSVANHEGFGIYRPMALVRYDDAANVGNQTYPDTTLNAILKFNLDTKSTAITRLGLVVGFSGDNCGVLRVQIMDSSNNDITASVAQYLLIGTVAQAVARGQIPSSQLIANGGTLDPVWYVAGTSTNDNLRMGASRYRYVPIADDPNFLGGMPAAGYRLWLTNTLAKGAQQNTSTVVDRSYPLYAAYGTATMAHTDAGAQLFMSRDLNARNDASANETATLAGFITGSGHSDSSCTGGAHGNNNGTSITYSVDGVAQVLYAKTLTRASTGTTKTLVFDRSITSPVGATFTATTSAGTGYNVEGATIVTVSTTTLANDTITYVGSASSSEVTTADTGGQYIDHSVIIGTNNVSMTINSNFFHPQEGATVVATGAMTYILSYLGYFEIQPKITLAQNYTLTASCVYGALRTFWGAVSATYGPEYLGLAKMRQLSGGVAQYLTANDNSEVMVGETVGYAGYTDGGMAQVWEFVDSTAGVGKVLIQESTSTPPNHVKGYMRMVTTNTTVSSGFSYGIKTRTWIGPIQRLPVFGLRQIEHDLLYGANDNVLAWLRKAS